MSGRRRTADHYARRAKRENYPARSIYKLEEINKRTKLLRRGDRVIDLGAAPGSWTLYASDQVGPTGFIVAIDRAPLTISPPANVHIIEANCFDMDYEMVQAFAGPKGFDAVISDMAPRTSGHRFVDQSRSYELFCHALEVSADVLRPGGRFVGKIFQGEDFENARAKVRELFGKAQIVRPTSVRTESYEVYIVGLDRKSPPQTP